MTSKSVVGRRLNRLIESGIRPAGNVSQYAEELERLAEKTADRKLVERQSRFFKALADETRLRILRLLEVRDMCVCEIMISLNLTQPNASHHLGLLENAGLVKDRKEGQWVFYSVANPELLKNLHGLGIL